MLDSIKNLISKVLEINSKVDHKLQYEICCDCGMSIPIDELKDHPVLCLNEVRKIGIEWNNDPLIRVYEAHDPNNVIWECQGLATITELIESCAFDWGNDDQLITYLKEISYIGDQTVEVMI